jgi:hypothetical protein
MTGGQKTHSRMRECLAADFFYIIVCKLYFPWLMNDDAFYQPLRQCLIIKDFDKFNYQKNHITLALIINNKAIIN